MVITLSKEELDNIKAKLANNKTVSFTLNMIQMEQIKADMELLPSYPPLSMNTRIPFGKYKGETVSKVAKHDKKYIKWLANKWEGDVDSALYKL